MKTFQFKNHDDFDESYDGDDNEDDATKDLEEKFVPSGIDCTFPSPCQRSTFNSWHNLIVRDKDGNDDDDDDDGEDDDDGNENYDYDHGDDDDDDDDETLSLL